MSDLSPLDPAILHLVRAADGWLELGNPAEARAELGQIPAESEAHPLVLEAWWDLHAHEKDWAAALEVSLFEEKVAPLSPSGFLHHAYALRRLSTGGLQAAWDILLPAADVFPNEATIPYNLACYACQLGHLDEARRWFAAALRIGHPPALRTLALADPDLEPLWPELRTRTPG